MRYFFLSVYNKGNLPTTFYGNLLHNFEGLGLIQRHFVEKLNAPVLHRCRREDIIMACTMHFYSHVRILS